MTEFVMPTATKSVPRAAKVYPQAFVELVEENYRTFKVHGRDDQCSTFTEEAHAEAFAKLLKNYADNREGGTISIRVRRDGTSVTWYAKHREVRVAKPVAKPAPRK